MVLGAFAQIGRMPAPHRRGGPLRGARPPLATALALLAALVLAVASAGCGASSPSSPLPSTTAQTSLAPETAPVTPPRTAASTLTAAPPTSPPTAPSTAAASAAACGWAAVPPRTYQHVIWIWMENHQWTEVLAPSSPAPYTRSVAAQCGTATDYASVGSPSLPNYIGATSGSTQGISDDNAPPSHPLTADNLLRQVRAAGGSARSYEEGMSQPCQLSSAGRYAVKHNPAAYYVGATDRTACRSDDVPFSPQDLVALRLPTFAFVTPDLCHDTHDCGVSAGDAYLAGLLPGLLASPSYRSGTTAIFVIWDEYTPMPNLVIAPSVRPGTVVSQPFDHYALLRTTEELLGLPARLGAAAEAASLRVPFNL